jgi:hypothetical protein
MALCAPVLHATSCEKAVKAVSGEELLDEVMSDLILTSRGSPSSERVWKAGGEVERPVSAPFLGALGW